MILRWLDRTTLPVETDRLTPESVTALAPDELARQVLRVGNRDERLGEFFRVESDGSDVLTLEGDLRHARGLGRGMASGRLVVRGTAGAYLGAGMTGGEIEVFGDSGDWTGAAMAGGMVRVHGNAGRSLGAAPPGARLGMREGVILVDGSVGAEAAVRIRRGLIAVGGKAGEGLGRGMVAGSVFAFGPVGRYPGTGMKRGTIAIFGAEPVELLPSFAPTGAYRFPFLTIYLRRLVSWAFEPAGNVSAGEAGRYNGDLADGGRGEILVLR